MDQDRIRKAALEAEFDTGRREDTEAEARTHIFVRIGRMFLGTIVIIIGIIMLPLPGPGWLVIASGLTILARDVAWAERLLRYIRRRVPGVPEAGPIPRSTLVVGGMLFLAGIAFSIWWATR